MRLPFLALTALLIMSTYPAFASSGEIPSRAIPATDSPIAHPIGFYRMILPNPAPAEDESDVYHAASSHSQLVDVDGKPSPFYELASDLSGPWGDHNVGELIRGNGMFPVVEVPFFDGGVDLISPPGIVVPTLSNPSWRGAYRNATLDIVNASGPAFLCVGIEVNLWYEAHGTGGVDGFENWVSLYEGIYGTVKAISPNTTVFCSFAREMVEAGKEADLTVLDMFDPGKLDLIAFTSHPFAVPGISVPSDIPDDYYDAAYDHLSGPPMALSSIAWPSFSSFGGEQGQVDFIDSAVNRLTRDRGIDLRMIGWDHLTDRSSDDKLGLRNPDGTEKASLEAWRMNAAPYYVKENRTIDVQEDFGEFAYDLGRTFKDPDPWDDLTYKVRNETGVYGLVRNFTLLNVRIDGNLLRLHSNPDKAGYVQIMVQATDHDGKTVWALIQINVLGVNDPPLLVVPFGTLSVLEDHTLYIQVSYHIQDIDDVFEDLGVKVMASPNLHSEVTGEYLKVFSSQMDWTGDTYLVINVTDPDGLSLLTNVSFRVIPSNDPPEILLPGHMEIPEDGYREFDLSHSYIDVEGDPVTWNITVVQGGIMAPISNGTLTVRPLPDWNGAAMLHIVLDDGTDNESLYLNVTVLEINDPPRTDPVPVLHMTEDVAFYFNLSSINPFDVEGMSLSWQVRNYSALLRSVSIMDNGSLRLNPMTDDFGTGSVNATLKDSEGGTTEVEFPVNIGSVNDPPYLLMRTNASYRVTEGSYVLIDLERSPFVLYDVESPNSELTIVTDSTKCRVQGMVLNVSIPLGTVVESFIIHLLVRDPQGAESNETAITISVKRRDNSTIYRLSIDRIETDVLDGRITITAYGGTYQIVWVVFDDGVSMKMTETPPGNGKYILTLDEGPWPDGTTLRFHLSTEEDGPNDTPWAPYEFVYTGPAEVDEKDMTWTYALGATLLIALLIVLGLLFLIRRAMKRDDQGAFLEE